MRLTPRTYREHSGLERIVKFKLRHYQTETLPVFVIKSGIRPERRGHSLMCAALH